MSEINVLVTGSRYWTNEEAMRRKLGSYPAGTVLVQGGARGADKMAAEIGSELGFTVVTVPAEWNKFGKAAGFVRNQAMLEGFLKIGGGDVIAFKADFGAKPGRGGTEHMVRLCREAGLHGWIVRQ